MGLIPKANPNQTPGIAKPNIGIVAVKQGHPMISKGARRLALA